MITQIKEETIEILISEMKKRKGFAIVNSDYSFTYAQFLKQVDIISKYIKKNVQPGSIVAVLCKSSWQTCASFFGIIDAGCIALLVDSSWADDWIESVLIDAKPVLILTTDQDNRFDAKHEIVSGLYASTTTEEGTKLPSEASYVIYTSGTTGKPKGVINSKAGLINLFFAVRKEFALRNSDCVLQFSSPSFDAWVWEICQAFSAGATLIIPNEAERLPGNGLEKTIKEYTVTVATLPPSVLEHCSSSDFQQIHTLITAGERCSKSLVSKWASGRRLFNAYGPSEAAVCATLHKIISLTDQPSIGRALTGVTVWVQGENGEKITKEGKGELIISGKSVGLGYINLPELSRQKFINNGRDFRTGDCVTQDASGLLYYEGRLDNQVKVNGVRIELEYVEKILEMHATVDRAVVTTTINSGLDKKLIAFVLVKKGYDKTRLRKELINLCKNKLSARMSPLIIFVSDLPMKGSGKADIALLVKNHLKNDKGNSSKDLTQLICNIFQSYLGIEKISEKEDFFELGGTSLGMFHCISEIEKYTKSTIPPILAMRHSTPLAFSNSLLRYFKHLVIDEEPPLSTDDIPQLVMPRIIRKTSNSTNVFLTGGTGLLGAYMLRELFEKTDAIIYCLVRASDDKNAFLRVKENLKKHGFWTQDYMSRLHCLAGNLEDKNFGLSQKNYESIKDDIGFVYHVAANVSWILSYSALYGANVAGTNNAIALSMESGSKLIYVSSIGVEFVTNWRDVKKFEEDTIPPLGDHLLGYLRTKWMSEKLISAAASKGLKFHIFRPPFICGEIGAASFIASDDFLLSKIQACLQFGVIPDSGFHVDIYPANHIASEMLICATQEKYINQTYQLSNNSKLSWNEVPQFLHYWGFKLDVLPYDQWLERVCVQNSPLTPHLAYIQRSTQKSLSFYEHYQGEWPEVVTENIRKVIPNRQEPPTVINLIQLYISK